MNDNLFLDTNVLVYTYSTVDTGKKETSRDLVSSPDVYISTQVLQEMANTLSRRFSKPWNEIEEILREIKQNCSVSQNSYGTILQACRIAARYRFSFYDSLIISAALETNCSTLYSGDMNHNQVIEGRLKIINPFK